MKILTKRIIMQRATNKKRHCFDIIFEWEDILAKGLKCSVIYRSNFEFKFDEYCRKLYKIIPIPFYRLFNMTDARRGQEVLLFDASTKRQDGIYNHKRYIPCLIDYFLSEEMYPDFLKAYKNNSLVLVSSREVYEYLLKKDCPFKIAHFPLSLSDQYLTDEVFEKEYDLVVAGRENPLLMEYVERYEKDHPDAKIIRRKYVDGHFSYYVSSTGAEVSCGDSRQEYMSLLRKSRIALYTTPGMDGTRPDANGWNQVTPRFLEEIAAQCHIIARYPDNADTRWYEMNEICGNVKSYEEFEDLMERYRLESVDTVKYHDYLSRHITSRRVSVLEKILKERICY
ncbi:hypothetical protein AALA79_11885 [Lachnospiraceae bacterium 64-25]